MKFAEAKGARSLADLRAMSWKDLSAPVAPFDGSRAHLQIRRRRRWLRAAGIGAGRVRIRQAERRATLTGANKHEGGATPHPDVTVDAFQKQARQRFGDLADEFLALYPAATDDQARVAQNESSWDQARASSTCGQ